MTSSFVASFCYRPVAVVGRHIAQGLEVLRDQKQLGDLLGAQLLSRSVGDGVPQAVDDGPALPRDTFALQLRRIRLSLCSLHHLRSAFGTAEKSQKPLRFGAF